jgi:hypothetical protein
MRHDSFYTRYAKHELTVQPRGDGRFELCAVTWDIDRHGHKDAWSDTVSIHETQAQAEAAMVFATKLSGSDIEAALAQTALEAANP